ncbi:hypothetical protein MKK75_02440 [Methylobacterium sp. J-030]|nr:hypothetical protein [Methylobacterium sp. J-030]
MLTALAQIEDIASAIDGFPPQAKVSDLPMNGRFLEALTAVLATGLGREQAATSYCNWPVACSRFARRSAI